MGIWIREIRSRTGLPQAQVRKALKVLEQRKLVKSVKVIAFIYVHLCVLFVRLCYDFAGRATST